MGQAAQFLPPHPDAYCVPARPLGSSGSDDKHRVFVVKPRRDHAKRPFRAERDRVARGSVRTVGERTQLQKLGQCLWIDPVGRPDALEEAVLTDQMGDQLRPLHLESALPIADPPITGSGRARRLPAP